MDIVAASEIAMEPKEIFNQVRLNLRLLAASDIIKAHRGAEISPNIPKGESTRTSTLNWPQVADIPKHWIEIFSSIVRNIITPHVQSRTLGA